jgi:hypothetical protein
MKCIVCEQRKGKRSCPARGTLICTQCCGEKRVLEINCPESCVYLAEGRARESEQERDRFVRTLAPTERARYSRLTGQFSDFIVRLEYAFADERRGSRDLRDYQVAEALDLLLKTLRTEDKGILYEHTSEDLLVEGLRRRLRELVEAQRNPQQENRDPYAISQDPEPMKLGDVIDCLDFIRSVVEHHLKDPSPPSYVNFLFRLLPGREAVQSSASSIIIP